jgi:hypothetical protein
LLATTAHSAPDAVMLSKPHHHPFDPKRCFCFFCFFEKTGGAAA